LRGRVEELEDENRNLRDELTEFRADRDKTVDQIISMFQRVKELEKRFGLEPSFKIKGRIERRVPIKEWLKEHPGETP